METNEIRNINDLAHAEGYDTIEEFEKSISMYPVYPVTIEYNEKTVTLRTDADRVPFTKILHFPFT